jgi:HD-GYP domain-containing protein (c-di-GMP phosphodiesterase class II)
VKILSSALQGVTEAQIIARDAATQVGEMLALGPSVRDALGQCLERWDGKFPAGPQRLKGEEISLAARLYLLAHDAEVFERVGGVGAAVSVVRQRAGKAYDPRIAAHFCAVGGRLLARLQSETAWDAVLEAEPAPTRSVSTEEFEQMARTVANFVDICSDYTLGHSPGVATLAGAAALGLGLSDVEAAAVRQAGFLHDLGRAGVPVSAWNKPEPLTPPEWERMKRHPALTELVLARSSALGHLGTLAGLHHEPLDGSGYRAVPAASLPVTARLLAVADVYRAKLEPRPHRPARTPDAAAAELRREAHAGRLDGEAVDGVLAAAGHRARKGQRAMVAGLSEREVEVLRLIARGHSIKQIAGVLTVAEKTVDNHIQHIYAKIDVSTRAGATLFAMEQDLLSDAGS